MSKEALLK